MNVSTNTGLDIVNSQARKLFFSPHFWIIFFLICGISFIYYYYSYPDIDSVAGQRPWAWYLVIFENRINFNGMVLVIPMLYSLIRFGWVGGLITWACCLVIILPYILNWNFNPADEVLNIVLLSIVSLGGGFLIMGLMWRKREIKIAAERESERQTYMAQIFKAHEDERAHIAHELHDETIQTLIALSNRLQSISLDQFGILPSLAKEQVEWVRDTTVQISQDIRKLSRDLRPSILDNLGLIPALNWLVNQLTRNNEVENASIVFSGEERKLPPEADVMIFRIVQEAINNIKRHAQAKNVVVSIKFEPSRFNLTIEDDGCGFILPPQIGELVAEGKLGLIGIQQRVQFLRGNFDIQSMPGEGTVITIIIDT